MSSLPTHKYPHFRIPSSADHERISALFLGPKGENAEFLHSWFNTIVAQQKAARDAYFPEDEAKSKAFVQMTEIISSNLTELLTVLGQKSIPFYSPRYSAHMSVDQSLPAILGYISTMFFNPNNVAFEASPLTTLLELECGLQLCEMMGYNRLEGTDAPVGWGHIASGGTVANLESMWWVSFFDAPRNLKFYPLSLRDASAEGAELAFIRDSFAVKTCTGETKLLKDCTAWELLNLKVETILDMPDRLHSEYRISPEFLDSVMSKYIIQSINKDTLMQKWGIDAQPVILSPSTNHYSWPKAAAVLGIGSDNLLNVAVDKFARMDTVELDKILQKCLDEKRAVYQVVAVIGTTEEGGVDRIEDIIQLREKYNAKGMSFVVHADAAWGGDIWSKRSGIPKADAPGTFVPHVGLRKDTARQLAHLKFADSITVDPHKAGYIPYPAGALCYRDGRMRYLLTWSAPYLHQGSEGESIGVYGVEGRRQPGAAAAAVFMAHETIGLTPSGHGSLLGQAMYTCRRYASHWSAMSTDDTSFVVVPFNPIPAELEPSPDPKKIEEQKEFIRKNILYKSNTELYHNPEAMELLNQLGSDLNINVFACNFRYLDGTLNTDIEEANWLNRRIFERLSVTSAEEDPLSIPFYLTSTTFKQADYGVCATEMKRRMGLVGNQDLVVLRNVVMSPFTTVNDFVGKMADVFQKVLEEEVKNARIRNEIKPGIHTFLLHGSGEKCFLVHTPTIHMASGRRQIILSVDLEGGLPAIRHAHEKVHALIIHNSRPMLLDDIVDGSSFEGKVTVGRSLVSFPHAVLLYGTPEQMHLDHVILVVPNINLSAGEIQCEFDKDLRADDLAKGLIVVAQNVHEASMQPFPLMENLKIDANFFFNVGKTLQVVVYKDPYPASTMDPVPIENVKEIVTKGTITLTGNLYVDSDALNVASEASADAPLLHNKYGSMTPGTIKSWNHAVHQFHKKMATVVTK
ncbi:pyridoxal phosphate-dependent transferase [Flammula alnicola]|nr:pyridoxal phosphate-dependent transferase [Flammula alnicola]